MDALFVSVGSRGVMCCVGRKWLDACDTVPAFAHRKTGAETKLETKASGAGELSGVEAEVKSI